MKLRENERQVLMDYEPPT
uniref:Uncharacterized protein n=1 Tax=Arundo donax TaxID=35708 RepID=A0A0A9ECK2_ARUDO